MRTSRIRTAALAAATAALALGGLTACGGTDTATDNAKNSASDDASKNTGTDGRTTDKDPAENTGSKSAASDTKSDSDTASLSQCGDQDLDFSVVHRFAGEQGEHLLITGQNNKPKPCWVTSYPTIKLGDTNEALPLSKEAEGGKSRITVQPGGKVYSAAALFADEATKNTSSNLALALRDETGNSNVGVSLNAHDGKGTESKFTWSSADVLNWNTEKPYDF